MRHFKHFFVIAVLFCFTLFGFQNCSQPISESEEISSIASGAPWAFDAKVDTIAHMSCGAMGPSYDREAFFSYAGGAFHSGSGLKYTSAYIQHTGGVSPGKRQQILAESSVNKGAKFQVAVRRVSNIKEVLSTSQDGLTEGFAYGSFPGVLSSPEVALSLPQNTSNSRVRNFGSLGPVVVFNDLVQSTTSGGSRNELNSGAGILGFTFSNEFRPSGGVGPSENRAYGQGLLLSFKRPSHINTTNAITQIASATEYNLENGSLTGSSWTCSSNLKYLIVRAQDIGVTSSCGGGANRTPGVEEIPANSSQAAELAELRKFLPVSKWGIDLAGRCIVLKQNIQGSCYGSSNVIRYPSNGSTCDIGLNTCPHYVSICKRN